MSSIEFCIIFKNNNNIRFLILFNDENIGNAANIQALYKVDVFLYQT